MVSSREGMLRRRSMVWVAAGSAAVLGAVLTGCDVSFPGVPSPPVFNNTTDKSNGGAKYLSSSACRACHPAYDTQQSIHGHAHKLTRVEGQAPAFPSEATRAGVPNPPDGFSWADISYVIGGYIKKARFIDHNGYILTTGLTGKPAQWNLLVPANGTMPGFVNYEATAVAAKPYDVSCFECHTTGPARQDEDNPLFQENRPGFIGTWVEAGVQCEACHGPGSNHVGNTSARNIFVDSTSAKTCRECHNRPFNAASGEILASGGFIQHHEQWPELMASGGHANFACTVCHDPHRSVIYDRANAIRTSCTTCHADANMALHQGKVFVRGDYREELTCESCHMPFVTKSASSASTATVGALGRMGDTRTHIFRITTENIDYRGFFTADGSRVVRDSLGRAAVTADFVCLRCHNEVALPNLAFTVERASEIAIGVHSPPQPG